jgi:hypothetical protein
MCECECMCVCLNVCVYMCVCVCSYKYIMCVCMCLHVVLVRKLASEAVDDCWVGYYLPKKKLLATGHAVLPGPTLRLWSLDEKENERQSGNASDGTSTSAHALSAVPFPAKLPEDSIISMSSAEFNNELFLATVSLDNKLQVGYGHALAESPRMHISTHTHTHTHTHKHKHTHTYTHTHIHIHTHTHTHRHTHTHTHIHTDTQTRRHETH